jgi:hypothetical protein
MGSPCAFDFAVSYPIWLIAVSVRMTAVPVLSHKAQVFQVDDRPNDGPAARSEQMGDSIQARVALRRSVIEAIDNCGRDALLHPGQLVRKRNRLECENDVELLRP